MARRRGWSQFDTDEKLQALLDDMDQAYALIDKLKSAQEETNATVRRIAAALYELQQRR
jgi:hypothetical protein